MQGPGLLCVCVRTARAATARELGAPDASIGGPKGPCKGRAARRRAPPAACSPPGGRSAPRRGGCCCGTQSGGPDAGRPPCWRGSGSCCSGWPRPTASGCTPPASPSRTAPRRCRLRGGARAFTVGAVGRVRGRVSSAWICSGAFIRSASGGGAAPFEGCTRSALPLALLSIEALPEPLSAVNHSQKAGLSTRMRAQPLSSPRLGKGSRQTGGPGSHHGHHGLPLLGRAGAPLGLYCYSTSSFPPCLSQFLPVSSVSSVNGGSDAQTRCQRVVTRSGGAYDFGCAAGERGGACCLAQLERVSS